MSDASILAGTTIRMLRRTLPVEIETVEEEDRNPLLDDLRLFGIAWTAGFIFFTVMLA